MGSRLLVDRYELLQELGRGGMATVWRAHDRRLDRPVAVKIAHPDPNDALLARRVEREARLAASIAHRSVVTVFDSGTADGEPFLVMELLDGVPLSSVIGTYDGAKAIDLGAALADGLAAIHAAGIVHRDVKPGNVVITADGPKLTDFGIARGDDTDRLTKTDQIMGTPSYVAPEVLAGEMVAPSADVYALGVVLTELVTGTRPNQGSARVESGDPSLDLLLGSALDPDPSKRPSAGEFGASLRRGQVMTAPLVAPPFPSRGPLPTAPADAASDTQVLAGLPEDALGAGGRTTGRRRWIGVAVLLLTSAVIGVATLLAFSLGADDGAIGGSSTSSVPVETTTASATVPTVMEVTPTTKAVATTSTTDATTTTTQVPPADEAAADFLSWAAGLRSNELKPKDRRKLFTLVEDLLRQGQTAEDRHVDKQLEELERLISRIDGAVGDEGMKLFQTFAASLV